MEVGFRGHQLIFNIRLGGRAISWQYQGIELLGASGEDPVEFGFYPMVPWAGRLVNNAIFVDGELSEQDVNYQGWALQQKGCHFKQNKNDVRLSALMCFQHA